MQFLSTETKHSILHGKASAYILPVKAKNNTGSCKCGAATAIQDEMFSLLTTRVHPLDCCFVAVQASGVLLSH